MAQFQFQQAWIDYVHCPNTELDVRDIKVSRTWSLSYPSSLFGRTKETYDSTYHDGDWG